MGSQAAADALHDAGLSYNDLQAAVASYCYGDPTCGQRALYGIYMCTLTLYNGWFILYITYIFYGWMIVLNIVFCYISLLQNLVGQVFGCMYIWKDKDYSFSDIHQITLV